MILIAVVPVKLLHSCFVIIATQNFGEGFSVFSFDHFKVFSVFNLSPPFNLSPRSHMRPRSKNWGKNQNMN